MGRHIYLEAPLTVNELERRYRAAKEPHERSWKPSGQERDQLKYRLYLERDAPAYKIMWTRDGLQA